MFTLKFYNGKDSYNVISCPHYNVYEGTECVEVTVYKDFFTEDGVTYRIAEQLEVPHYTNCFVENSAGKTIANIKHYK